MSNVNDNLIEVQHLTKSFGELTVLDDISEKIRQGEKELEIILKQLQKYKENQMKGIENAKRKGYQFGRHKKKALKDNTVETVMKLYDNQDITVKEAMQILEIARATFYRLRKEWVNVQLKEKEYESFKEN